MERSVSCINMKTVTISDKEDDRVEDRCISMSMVPLCGKYMITDCTPIGVGGFSTVFKADQIHEKRPVAIKVVDARTICNQSYEMLKNEVLLLKSMDHPNILTVIETFNLDKLPTLLDYACKRADFDYGRRKKIIHPRKGYCIIVYEHVDNGDVFEYISNNGAFTEKESIPIIRDVAKGIQHCHSHNIVHRDLKPENILLASNGVTKIGDFGLATRCHPNIESDDFVGTVRNAAPEVLACEPHLPKPTDVWGLGLLLYFLVTADFAWSDPSDDMKDDTDGEFMEELLQRQLTKPLEVPDNISPTCQDLLKQMLTVNPEKRITIEGVLSHPWLNGKN